MKQKITLKKIAQELNVSISTVSKALKNSNEIGVETRERIQAFAKFYNYRPNNIALSLKHRKTKTIGVIIPEVVHYFFAQVIDGIEKVASENGYNVIVALSNESHEKEVINMETLADSLIDGFILSLSKGTMQSQDFHHIDEVMSQGMPVVLFDRIADQIECDKVVVDDTQGAYQAVNHLIGKGRKNILLLTTQDYITVGRLRTQGYIKAIQDSSLVLDNELIIKVVDTHNSNAALPSLEAQIEKTISKYPQIDAIIAVNEIYAAAALRVLRQARRQVPDEIAVVCFTDGLISKFSSPTLTTVSQHSEEIGRKAAKILIDRLSSDDNEAPPKTEVIKCTVVERESS